MIGVGIDQGQAFVKGVAVQLFEDGSLSLLSAVIAPTADVKAKPDLVGGPIGRHRPAPFTKPPAVVATSHPDGYLDRVRLPLAPETGPMSDYDIIAWLLEGKIPPPAGTQVKEDLWDFLGLHYFRRSSDIETHGRKTAEGLFTRIPRPVAEAAAFKYGKLTELGLEPTILALLNVYLRLLPPGKEQGGPTLLLDIGSYQIQALLFADTGLVRSMSASMGDLPGLVERSARIERAQVHHRLQNTDVASSDTVSIAIKDAIVKTLQKVQSSFWPEGTTNPRPHRVLLCGGLSQCRGMSRIVNTALDVPTDMLHQPESLRIVGNLPAPYPVFAGALGAAVRAVGSAPLPLRPRKQVLQTLPKGWSSRISSMAHLPHGIHLPPGFALPQMPGLALPAMAVPEEVSRFVRTWDHALAWVKSLRQLPAKLGWGWIGVGVAAVIATIPTSILLIRQGSAFASAQAEVELLEPDTSELAREAELIRQYATLTGSGALTILPLGEVVAEIGARMPAGTYLAKLTGSPNQLVLLGRVKGNAGLKVKQISESLAAAPALRRAGYRLEAP